MMKATPGELHEFVSAVAFVRGKWSFPMSHWQMGRRAEIELFAEPKNQIGLRRLRLRRMKFVREQFFLAAAAQNIKRLVQFLSKVPSPNLAATA